jgi:hypothetical protein
LWHIDPLLGNYHDTNNERMTTDRQQLREYATVLEPLLGSGPPTTMEVLLEAVLSMWSTLRLNHPTKRLQFS